MLFHGFIFIFSYIIGLIGIYVKLRFSVIARNRVGAIGAMMMR